MSMRRSRIKPAINLAASRRSTAGSSKPSSSGPPSAPKKSTLGGVRSTPKPTVAAKEVIDDKPSKDAATRNQQSVLESKNDEKTNSAQLNLLTDEKSSRVEKGLKEATSQSSEKSALQAEGKGVQAKDDGKKAGGDIQSDAAHEPIATELLGKSTTSEEINKSTNPVRRKRITAVPNFSQRRAPVTSGKSSSNPKSRQAISRKESDVLSSSSTVADQKERRTENRTGGGISNARASDSKENEKTAEPPVVQRKILSQALGASQHHGNSEELDPWAKKVSEKDKTRVTTGRKDAPILDLITDNAVNGMPSGRPKEQSFQEALSSGNIYKNRLDEMNAFKKDDAPSNRRKRFTQHPKNMIDISKMKMKDLIYFNPKDNKMSSKGVKQGDKNTSTPNQVDGMSTPRRDEDEDKLESSPESPVTAAPQVKIGPDGNIIVDTQSLVKMVTPKRKMDESEITEVKEDSSTTTYASFRKSKYSAAWSTGETEKFYAALSTVGTDFSMINAIFPNRKRRELKNKFKREERMNGALVEQALRETKAFDFTDFQNKEDDDPTTVNGDPKMETKRVKKRKKRKQDHPEDNYVAPKNRKVGNNDDDEDIEIVEEGPASPAETVPPPDDALAKEQASKDALENLQNPFGVKSLLSNTEDAKSSGDEEEYDMDIILGKPTRSGRQPKQREVFTIQDTLSQPRVVRPNTEQASAGTKGKTGKRKKKIKHKRLKKGNLESHNTFSHDIGTVKSVPLTSPRAVIPPGTAERRVPPLHYDVALPVATPQSSLRANSSVQLPRNITDQRPGGSPSFRTEHYLVTYPDGTKTLIQMPVPVENDRSFEFVLNVLPSPYREGSTLQLGIVPKESNFSPHTPAQPFDLGGGVNLSLRTPISQIVTPRSTPGNVSSPVGLSGSRRVEASPLLSVPGSNSPSSSGVASNNQSSQYVLHSSSLVRTPIGRTAQLVQSVSSSSPMPYNRESIRTPAASNTYCEDVDHDVLNSGTTALPQESILNKSPTQLTGIITPGLNLGNSFNQSSSSHSVGPERMLTTSVTQERAVISSNSNNHSTVKSGFAQIEHNLEQDGIRPPKQILSSETRTSHDGLLTAQDVVKTASKKGKTLSCTLPTSSISNVSIRMDNYPSKEGVDQRPIEELITHTSQLVAVNNPIGNNSSIENSVTDIETEMVYVSGLVDPIPAGSEVSDPIIAQHVDVSSSVQQDELQVTESEVFVPV